MLIYRVVPTCNSYQLALTAQAKKFQPALVASGGRQGEFPRFSKPEDGSRLALVSVHCSSNRLSTTGINHRENRSREWNRCCSEVQQSNHILKSHFAARRKYDRKMLGNNFSWRRRNTDQTAYRALSRLPLSEAVCDVLRKPIHDRTHI